jgi:peptide/nickel transport system substrate-binding protein
MRRRTFLAAGAGLVAPLAAPALVRAAGQRTLKFIPQADLAVLDPIWTTAYVSRNHGLMVFDTLYGYDANFAPQPQMVEGHRVEDDGRTWLLTLRPGLSFHDKTPVLARDCVASIRRWAKRDAFGQTLLASTDELSAPDDRTIRFWLKKPFPLLPTALGKPGSNICAIMPERLAQTDAFTQVTEMVGSGPYRFRADERVAGSQFVYERFDAYRPREDGAVGWNAGPKRVNFDRVEWHVIPDAATAAAALQTGEMDWWELPTTDMVPLLRRAAGLRVEIKDPTGQMGCMRLNHLHPPFDNPAIRRALLLAVSQEDYMIAVGGEDPERRHVPAGTFTPKTPMASEVGLEAFTRPRDYDAARRAITEAGYKGERVVLMAPTDFPILKAMADIGADVMQKIGLNVDYQATDWGTVVQRRAKKDPPTQGGWNVFHTFWAGLDQASPAGHVFLRGQGPTEGTMGWPSSPKIEALRTQWLDAPDLASQKALAVELQQQALTDLPYVPVGQNFYPTAYRPDIDGVVTGSPVFWNVRRT